MNEQRQIVAGTQLIYHAIYSQSGSLEKALLEYVMNSIDAGASRIDVTLDREQFVVTDDGTGFSRLDDI